MYTAGTLIADVRRVTCSDLVGPQPSDSKWVTPTSGDLRELMPRG